MHIFIISPSLARGGAERVAALWACGFHRRGHQVTVITKTSDQQVYPLDEGIEVLPYYPMGGGRLSKLIGGVRLIRSYCRKQHPDVVIGIMNVASMMGWFATRGLHIPVIATEHNSFERPESAPMTSFDHFVKFHFYKLYPLVTVLTQADKDFIGSRLQNAIMLPNPLALKPIQSIQQKEKNILATGRLDNWHCKGFDLLIKAFASLSEKCRVKNEKSFSWRLQIAGTGSEENLNYLKQLCREQGVEDKVDFLGFRRDIETLYQKAAIFVLSSRYEGFGMVLIEAMSQGCACIACDYKGRQREIITQEDEGLICPVEDVDALAKAMQRLVTDEPLRRKLQEGAVRRSHAYEIDHIMNLWSNLLSDILRREVEK